MPGEPPIGRHRTLSPAVLKLRQIGLDSLGRVFKAWAELEARSRQTDRRLIDDGNRDKFRSVLGRDKPANRLLRSRSPNVSDRALASPVTENLSSEAAASLTSSIRCSIARLTDATAEAS